MRTPPNPQNSSSPGPVTAATTGALINEFRASGPGTGGNSDADDFVEVYNSTNTTLDLTGWKVFSNGTDVGTIPSGKSIKPYGRLLLTGTGYSLTSYASSDVALTGDVVATGTLELRNAANTVVDTVNAGGLPAPTSATSDYSFERRMDGADGAPQVGGDFNTVDVNSTAGPDNTTGLSSNILRLGAPGPQNLASPIVANGFIKFTQMSLARSTTNPNILIVRGTVQNLTSTPISSLRFRAVSITAGSVTTTGAGTPANVSLTSSTSTDGTNLPLSLQVPPAQPNGGGLNASVSLASSIGANATVTVEFALTIIKSGTFRMLINAEPVFTP